MVFYLNAEVLLSNKDHPSRKYKIRKTTTVAVRSLV